MLRLSAQTKKIEKKHIYNNTLQGLAAQHECTPALCSTQYSSDAHNSSSTRAPSIALRSAASPSSPKMWLKPTSSMSEEGTPETSAPDGRACLSVDSRAARGAVSCAGDGSRAALAATPDGEGGGEVNSDGEGGEQNHCTRTY